MLEQVYALIFCISYGKIACSMLQLQNKRKIEKVKKRAQISKLTVSKLIIVI